MGAWEYGSYKTPTGSVDSRLGSAFIAIKRELAYNGFEKNLVLDTPVFGDAATNRTKEFQASKGLKADGQVGPTTSRELFRRRTEVLESVYGFTHGTLGNLVTLESAWDPVAIGYADTDDHGMVQINLRIHSDVSVEDAFSPSFALSWAAEYIEKAKEKIISEINVRKAARASYNIGTEYAKRWMNDGYPESGGVFDSSGIDWYKRANDYINLIDKQSW